MTDKKSDKAKTQSGQSIKETLPQKTVSRKKQQKNEKKRRLFSTLRYQVGLPPALALILPSLATRHASAQNGESLLSTEQLAETEHQAIHSESPKVSSSNLVSKQELIEPKANLAIEEGNKITPSARLQLNHYHVHAITNPHLLFGHDPKIIQVTTKEHFSSSIDGSNSSAESDLLAKNNNEPSAKGKSKSLLNADNHENQQSSENEQGDLLGAPGPTQQYVANNLKFLNQQLQVKEDGLIVHGQLIAADKNTNETISFATNTQVDGLTLHPDGTYTFDPTDTVYQSLKEGEVKELTVPVTVTDSVGLTSHANFVIQVTGTNDIPNVTGKVSGHIQEDINVDSSGLLTVAGQVQVHDIDYGESHTLAEVIKGRFGTLTIDEQGHWQYQVDNSLHAVQQLSSQQKITETISIHTADHTSQNIQIVIGGSDDNAVISGIDSGAVVEDLHVKNGSIKTQGDLTIVDTDIGEAHFASQVLVGQFGSLNIDANGHWSYEANNLQAAVQQLGKGDELHETFTVASVDGTTHEIKIEIDGVNDLPVMAGQSQSLKEDGAVFHGQMVATDVDQDLLTYTTSNPIDGLTFNSDGSYTFDPSHASYQHLSKGDTQVVTTMVTVTDTAGGTHREELKFTITGTNDLPMMAGQSQSVKEDGAVFHGQMVATDVDQDLLTYTTSNPIDGLTFNSDGSYTFDPSHASYQHLAVGDTQTVKTTVIVTDTAGGQDQKELSFVIEGTNDKPTVTPITAQFHEDQSQHLDINLLSQAQDVDGDALSVGSLFQVKVNGHIERLPDGFGIVNGHLQVDPSSSSFQHLAQGEVATFELSYNVTDGHGASTPQSVTVKIVGTDDNAQLVSSSINIGEAAAEHTYHGTSIKGTLQLTDIDTHDNPQFVDMIYQSSSRLGTLALRADGHYEYFLYGNYIGTANAQKTVAALKPGESITETFNVETADGQTKPVTVTIHGEEDSAQIVVNYGTTDNHLHEDSMTSPAYPTELFATGIVKAIDPDHDDDQLKPQTLVSAQGGHFTVTETGMWQYHIDNSLAAIQKLGKGESFQEQFTVESKDGSAQKVITVTVHGTNDDPEVSSTVTLPPSNEDKPYIISSAALLANASDVDANDAGHLSVSNLIALKADGSSAGTITDNHNGSFTFTPDLNYNGPVRFNYEVHDGHGGSVITSASASLKPVSDNAQISYASTDHHLAGVTEDRGYIDTHDELHFEGKLDIVDPDQGEAEFDINYGPQTYNGIGYDTKLGGHILLMRDGHYTYTIRDHQPQVQSLSQGEVLTDQCVVRAKDGTTFTIEVNIHGTNDAPTLSAQTQAVTEDGNSLNGQMQGRDIDHGATLTYSIAHAIDGLTFNADGSYSFDPSHTSYQQLKDGEHKIIDIPVTVTDEHGANSTQNLTINLQGKGDAAVIGGVDTGDVHENQAGQDKSPDYAQPGVGVIGQDSLTTSGQLTIVDPDSGESEFDPNGKVYSYSGQYGHLLLRPDGHWDYAVAAGTHDWHLGSPKTTVGSTIDQLGKGETLTDTVTVHSKDGTTHDIVITIHGDNDAPYVSSEVTLQSGKEDVSQTFTKADLLANAVDVDSNDAGLMTVSNLLADHGSIRDNHDGTYTYTPELNYHGKVHFSYDINDVHGGSTPSGASLDLASANDASVLAAGQDSGSVTEDHLRSGTAGQLWSGWTNLDVTDVDSASDAEVAFIEVNGIKHAVPADFGMSLTANHGYFSTTHSTDGHNKWSYTADNTSSEIQGLKTGQQLQDTMVIITKDGTRIPVTATIQGQDDHVIIDTPDALTAAIGTAVEDIKTTVVGMLQAHDLDKDDQVSFELAGAASSQAGSYGTFYVDRSGHWHYDLDASKVDSLRSGDGKAEAFNIVAISSDGSRATQKVEILVKGTDDAAIITGQSTGSVTEDLHVQGDARHTVFTGGVLDAKDPDIGQRGFHQTLNAHAISDPYGGSLSIDKAGGWIYSVPNGNLQHLAQGETEHVQYQVQTLGGDTHVITVDIVGTNDKPTLTAQTQTVNEDGSLLNGQMQGSDIDHGATLAYSIAKPVDGLTFNADGSYTFDPTNASYDHLAKGQTQTLAIPVTVTDEHGASATKDLNITVTGTNDAAQITGADSGDVYESTYADRSPDYQRGIISHLWNDSIHTSGKLDIVDHDSGEAHFDNNAPTYQYFGQYGRLILQPDGDWYYHVGVGDSAIGRKIDALNTGENLTDTITIRSADGTTHDVVITIHGDNDSPFASGEVQLNSGKEDQVQTITQAQLLANSMDVDSSDAGKLHVDNLQVDHGSIRDNQDGTYTFTPAKDYNGQIHFTYDVLDAHGGTTHTGANTTLAAVDDKTTISGVDHGTATEDVATHMSTNVNIMDAVDWQALQITDVDSPNTQVTVEFAGQQYTWDLGSDLDVTTPYGKFQFHTLVSGPHAGEHSWSYIGDNSNVHVQELKHGESLTESIKLIATDGTEFPITVQVNGTEDGVVIDSKSELGHVVENAQTGASVAGSVTAHDTDLHDSVSWTATPTAGVSGQYGSFHLSADGQWHYDVDQSKATKLGDGDEYWEHFTIEAVSTDGSKVSQSVSVVVRGNNDVPVVSGEVTLPSGKEDSSIHITQAQLIANATDVDSNDRGWLHAENLTADHGSITANSDGSFTFNPDPNYNGTVHFTYDVADRHGGIAHTGANTTLAAVNDRPDVQPITDSIKEDSTNNHSVDLLTGATDKEGDALSVSQIKYSVDGATATTSLPDGLVLGADGHSVIVDATHSTFQHLAVGQAQQVVVSYLVNDGHGGQTPQSATLTIEGTDDKAVLTSNVIQMSESEALLSKTSIYHGNLQLTDPDTGDHTQFAFSGRYMGQGYAPGDLTVWPDGSYQFRLESARNRHADDLIDSLHKGESMEIPYQVRTSDGQKLNIIVKVIGEDDQARIVVGQYSSLDNHAYEDNLSPGSTPNQVWSGGNLHVIDPDHGQAGFVTQSFDTPEGGHFSINVRGGWQYTIDNAKLQHLGDGQSYQKTFTVESIDGSAQQTITVTVHGSNDTPVVTSAVSLSQGIEDTPVTLNTADLLAHASDVDDHSLLSVHNLSVDHGLVVDNLDGTFSFTPEKNYHGQVQFTYDVKDEHGASVSTSATMNLAAVNDAATFTGDSASLVEDSNLQHNTRFAGSTTIQDALFCRGSLVISDVDGQGEAALDLKGQHQISQDGTYGHFLIKPSGSWVYAADNSNTNIQNLDNGQTLTDSIEITSIDGTKHSISVTISGSTDKPTIHSFTDSGVQNTGPIEGNLISGVGTSQGTAAAATDSDSNAHLVLQDIQIKDPVSGNYVAVTPGHPHAMAGIGTLAIEANGHYIFTPEAGFTGKVPNMVYRVGDDGGTPVNDSSQNTLSLEVKPPAQHAPTVTPQTVTSDEDQSHTFTAAEFGYQDTDHDALNHITITQLPSHGLLTLNGLAVTANQQVSKADIDAGHLTFTPIQNQSGANYAHFEFRANDGHQDSASASMVINVNAINDAPTVGSSFTSLLEDKPHNFSKADFKYADIDGDSLHHITITNIAHGSLTLNGQAISVGDDVAAADLASLIYTPTPNYHSVNTGGLGGIRYTANDGHTDSKPGMYLINIVAVPDPAVFTGDSTGRAQEDLHTQTAGVLNVVDPDGTQGFIAVQGGVGIVGSKGYGHAHIDSNGHWTYNLYNNHPVVQQLKQGQTDTETITVQAKDGTTHDIVITVSGTNDAPTVSEKVLPGQSAGKHVVTEDGNLTSTGQLTTHDTDGDTLSLSLEPSHGASYGSVQLDSHSNTWTYHLDNANSHVSALNDGDVLHDTFTVLVDDGHGGKTSQQVTMAINGHTDPVPYTPPTISVSVDARHARHVTPTITATTVRDYAHRIGQSATTASGHHEINGHGSSDIIIVQGRLTEEAELKSGNDILYIGGSLTDKEIEGGHGSDTLILGAYNRQNAPRLRDHGEKLSDGHEEMELEDIENIILGDGTVLKGQLPANFPVQSQGHYECDVNIHAQLSSHDETVTDIRITHLQTHVTLQSAGHTIHANPDGSYTVPTNGHVTLVSSQPISGSHHYFATEVTTHNSATGVSAVTTEDLQGHTHSHINPPPPPPPPVLNDEPMDDNAVADGESLTIMSALGISDVTSGNDDHQQHDASKYLDKLGITQQEGLQPTEQSALPDDLDIVFDDAEQHDITTEHQSDVAHHSDQNDIEHFQDIDNDHQDMQDPTLPDDPTR
ncbi:VCBS domain-containing protein [Vibrio mediterranei]|uniref:VCBS domain-containing protein n=4 Tax=Vibrio mediterranei TaxID=689 RepID=UPI0015E7AE88|nr:VCBS domain-containing protein [Vibrio mediterranei]